MKDMEEIVLDSAYLARCDMLAEGNRENNDQAEEEQAR
jgi:hypothetical protein